MIHRFPAYFKKSLQRDRVVYYDRRIGELQGAAIIAVCEKERADAATGPVAFPDLSEIPSIAVTLLCSPRAISSTAIILCTICLPPIVIYPLINPPH